MTVPPEHLRFLDHSVLYLEIHCAFRSRSSFHGSMSLRGDSLVAQIVKNLAAM